MMERFVSEPHATDRASVPAILAYICSAQITLFGIGLFVLITRKVPIEPVVLGVLGTYLAAITGNAGLALGYHLGASAGDKTANAALAQIAGAGPPPPAEPMSTPKAGQ